MLDVTTHDEAVHKLVWYARLWSIETFFKTLKTGCRIEEVRLTTADRLANFIALCCVVAWRIHWLTMLRRSDPEEPPAAVFTDAELEFLDHTFSDAKIEGAPDLDFYMIRVARLGDYLALHRQRGAKFHHLRGRYLWRGLSRLVDLVEGFSVTKAKLVGN